MYYIVRTSGKYEGYLSYNQMNQRYVFVPYRELATTFTKEWAVFAVKILRSLDSTIDFKEVEL